MQWNGYIPGTIHTTTLKDAIDIVIDIISTETKTEVTYSEPVKYYHFQFPDANKITIIVDTLRPKSCSNNFSFVVPGELFEASYSVYIDDINVSFGLVVNNKLVFGGLVWRDSLWSHPYGYYENLESNTPHFITFSQGRPFVQIPCAETSLATVLIYKN